MQVEIEHGQRDMILLALAYLLNERPGWQLPIGEIAESLEGKDLLEAFRQMRFAERESPVSWPSGGFAGGATADAERRYINAKLHDRSPRCGSFLRAFLVACLRADHDNYALLQPALHAMMTKYPADPLRSAMEAHDEGANVPNLKELLDAEYLREDRNIQPKPVDALGEADPHRRIIL